MAKLRYRKGEKQAMLKAGYPLCIPSSKTKGDHCNTCIKFYRKKIC